MRPIAVISYAFVALWGAAAALQAADPSPAQRAEVKKAQAAVTKAGNLYRAKNYQQAGDSAREALAIIAALPAEDSKAWLELLGPLEKQLTRARELLAGQGVTIPRWRTGTGGQPVQAVSFAEGVAPILLAKCGGCHVNESRGEFSMASFTALMRGSTAGIVVRAGDAAGSRLIEVLESGDMPRGGAKLTDQELSTLKAWIDGGAKFDGSDPAAGLASLVPGGAPGRAPGLTVVMAESGDAVQFARDLGPLLVKHCLECHGEANGGNGFSLHTFDRLLRGGGNGPPFVAGDASMSLLIKKLRGTAPGARMPQGREPLAEEIIARFEQWIELGGRFDGYSSAALLPDAVSERAAEGLSHEELAQQRVERAEKNWRLILPDMPFNRQSSRDVLVVGGVGNEILEEVVKTADAQIAQLRKLFKVPDSQPLVKGRVTLYVFDKRYDYGEVGTMLERRELPSTWRGHWTYSPLDPYGCILLSDNGQAPPGVVAQQIAGLYLAGLGSVPRWFAEGSARAIASRLDPRDARIKSWDQQTLEVLSSTETPAGFLAGTLAPEESDVLSYSFVSKLLMSPTTRYVGIISGLQGGASFEEAFAKIYGGKPDELIPTWTNRVNRRGR